MEDIYRTVELGIKSVLVTDEGLFRLINQAKLKNELPNHFFIKISALISPPNPVTAKLMKNQVKQSSIFMEI